MKRNTISACLIGALSLFLEACGSDPVYIADSLKMKVYFEYKIAEVEVEINPIFQTDFEGNQAFDQLAYIEISSNPKQSLKVFSFIDPEILGLDWPFQILNKLPSGDLLPKPFAKSWLYEWKKEDLSYLLNQRDELSLGALFKNDEFKELPHGFLAVQNFYAEDGQRRGSVAVFGPSNDSAGGFFLIANMGKNPFENHNTLNREPLWEVHLKATERAEIISYGNYNFRHLMELRHLNL